MWRLGSLHNQQDTRFADRVLDPSAVHALRAYFDLIDQRSVDEDEIQAFY